MLITDSFSPLYPFLTTEAGIPGGCWTEGAREELEE